MSQVQAAYPSLPEHQGDELANAPGPGDLHWWIVVNRLGLVATLAWAHKASQCEVDLFGLWREGLAEVFGGWFIVSSGRRPRGLLGTCSSGIEGPRPGEIQRALTASGGHASLSSATGRVGRV
jgi:hypothetical protein